MVFHVTPLQAAESAKKGPECALKNRILFHASHKLLDENRLMVYHQKLTDTNEDQLSLAAIHYLRSHFQEVSRETSLSPDQARPTFVVISRM